MITLTIDNQKIQVPEGTTVLQAARSVGRRIPALCCTDGFKPSTSCMVCVVRVNGTKNLVPSCGMRVTDNMHVTTKSEEIQLARTAAIELLLSDHTGDCLGPCEIGCPANMDIPTMLRQIAAGDLASAIRTIKNDIPIPAILGRICPAPCEKVCRRAQADAAVSICKLKQFAADADLELSAPYQPALKPFSEKKAAVVGAGPAGLSAAYYLQQGGIACDLYDEHHQPGGSLVYADIDRNILPLSIVEKEINNLLATGIKFIGNFRLGKDAALSELINCYDAVVLATGPDILQFAQTEIAIKDNKIPIDRNLYKVNGPDNVYAAGACIGSRNLCVRSVADGKEAAHSILAKLKGTELPSKPFNHRRGRFEEEQLKHLIEHSSPARAINPQNGTFTQEQAVEQSLRCLGCDCGKKNLCGLRNLASELGAKQKTWQGDLSASQDIVDCGLVTYEASKCIKCGRCVQLARKNDNASGLAFEGRGFTMKIAVPLNGPLSESRKGFAKEYANICPTGAISLNHKKCETEK